MRTNLMAAAIPAMADPDPFADQTHFFCLRASCAKGGVQWHGFSTGNHQRAGSGERSNGHGGKNKTTHSSFLPIESKIIRRISGWYSVAAATSADFRLRKAGYNVSALWQGK